MNTQRPKLKHPNMPITAEQVRLYKAIHMIEVQRLLVRVCILVILVLLGFAIYFLFYDKVAAGICFTADGVFGWICHRVYIHYFRTPSDNKHKRKLTVT